MDKEKVKNALDQLNSLCNKPDTYSCPIHPTVIANLKDALLLISEDIKNEYPDVSNRLRINRDFLFLNKHDYKGNFISVFNPYRAGGILEALSFLLESKSEKPECIWDYIHPLIIESSKKLYLNGHYTNSAVDAFIEVNSRLKKIFTVLKPEEVNILDGIDLMCKIFSGNPPLFPLRCGNTETDKNIQQGFRFMFAGAMSALRNPKAHSNEEIISAEEALRRLMFASTLMFALDEAVNINRINETLATEN